MTGGESKGIKERRSLVEGVAQVDRTVEAQFVFAGKPKPSVPGSQPVAQPEPPPRNEPPATAAGRLPLSTRIRADYATALKRASLERQLSGTTPHTLQDILEEALGPWLAERGYLTPRR